MSRTQTIATEGIVLSSAMIREAGRKFWNNSQWQLRITDARGNKICAPTFLA
jgi:hypothetical protein